MCICIWNFYLIDCPGFYSSLNILYLFIHVNGTILIHFMAKPNKEKNFVVVFVSYKKKSENKVSSSSWSSSCLTTISTKSLSSLWSLAFAIRIDDEDLEWERGRTLCGNQFQSMKQNRNSGGWALITFRYHHDKRINI